MELSNKKANIVYLFPGPIYRPDLPDFKDRFEMLSEHFEGEIYSWTCGEGYREYMIGSFIFRGLVVKGPGLITRLRLAAYIIKSAKQLSCRKKIDVIICYDPIFTGIVGSILKHICACKLIVEVNSDIIKAPFLERITFRKKMRRFMYKTLMRFSLTNADKIKLLYPDQINTIDVISDKEKIFNHPDFTPTHYFSAHNTGCNDKNTRVRKILFIGYPFYLKGIDILIKAFDRISEKYPDVTLRLLGHELEQNAKLYFDKYSDRIEFCKGVPYDKIRDELSQCYCFVLPSRSEGFPRVLIEAMSCGKPVISSRVGGVPYLIEDGKNGFIFEPENVDQLVSKIEILLNDTVLADKIGKNGLETAKNIFSSDKYCEFFVGMVQATLNKAINSYKKSHILHLRSSCGFFGAEGVILNLAKELTKSGTENTIALINNIKNPHEELIEEASRVGLKTESIPCRGRMDWNTILKIRRVIQMDGIDILHCHDYKANFFGFLATRGLNVKIIATNHLWTSETLTLRFYEFLDGMLLNFFDKVVVVSDELSTKVGKALLSKSKLVTIYNGIDLNQYHFGNKDNGSNEIKDEFKIDKAHRLIGAVCRLSPQKGLMYLLEAAKKVLKVFPKATFFIAGDGVLREELKTKAEELAIDDNVIFAGIRKDVKNIYRNLDLFVMPSLKEGIPMALLEAMAMKNPVIATKVGGIPQVIESNKTGILIEPKNSDLLASAIIELLNDKEKAASLSLNGRKFVEENFSSITMANKYKDLYEQS